MRNQRYVQKALNNYAKEYGDTEFISIENPLVEKGVAPILKMTMQGQSEGESVSEIGLIGLRPLDFIRYFQKLMECLYDDAPSEEDRKTIAFLQDAMDVQVNKQKRLEAENT